MVCYMAFACHLLSLNLPEKEHLEKEHVWFYYTITIQVSMQCTNFCGSCLCFVL